MCPTIGRGSFDFTYGATPYYSYRFQDWKRGCRFLTKYLIHGGVPLHGTIHISGAKNAAVAIIPAALLVDGVCRIENVPQISDVTDRKSVV